MEWIWGVWGGRIWRKDGKRPFETEIMGGRLGKLLGAIKYLAEASGASILHHYTALYSIDKVFPEFALVPLL